jgi:hypothetical protein
MGNQPMTAAWKAAKLPVSFLNAIEVAPGFVTLLLLSLAPSSCNA